MGTDSEASPAEGGHTGSRATNRNHNFFKRISHEPTGCLLIGRAPVERTKATTSPTTSLLSRRVPATHYCPEKHSIALNPHPSTLISPAKPGRWRGQAPGILIRLQGGAAMEFFRQQQQLRDMDKQEGQMLHYLHQLIHIPLVLLLLLLLLLLRLYLNSKILYYNQNLVYS